MERLVELVREISRDADPSTPAFDARWSYVAANLLVPLVSGLVIACAIGLVGRVVSRLGGEAGEGD